jgi:hypothetical protein
MNFLKRLMDIQFGWIMYIPKTISKQIEVSFMPNKIGWREIKDFLNQQAKISPVTTQNFNNLELLILFLFYSFIALIMDEQSIAACSTCQSFIGFMSSYLPGIVMMSRDSDIPQMALLELSIAYTIIPVMILVFFYRSGSIQEYFIETPTSRIVIAYFFGVFLLLSIVYISLQKETIFLFDPSSKPRFIGLIAQTKIGLGIYMWWGTFSIAQVFGTWILMSFEIFKNLAKRIQKK